MPHHRINQVVIGGNAEQCGEHQGNGMADGEGGDELDDLAKARQKEHNTEQKQQMIIAAQHMGGAKPNVFQVTRIEYPGLVFNRHAMRPGRNTGKGRNDDK